MAVGANGTVMSSTNLTTWTVQTTGVTHTLRSVASSPSRFVAVGENAVGEGIILASPVGADTIYALVLTSPDGLTWTQSASRAIALDDASWLAVRHITSVAWSGTVLAMIGLDEVEPASWTSADASNWTRGTTPSEAVVLIPWGDIAWGNGRFVVVGGLGIGGAPTFTSTDGINWQVDSTVESLPPMNAVTSGDNEYIAVGDTHREWSADGAVWTATPMTDCGKDVVWDGARYVAVGSAICRSQ